MRIFTFLSLILSVKSFILNTPINIYKKTYNDDNYVKIYEPKNIAKKDLTSLIFYTGANSLIPGDIYSNFIRTLNNYNFSVIIVSNNNDVTDELLYDIRDEYKEIVPMAHSSGFVTAVQTFNKQKNINKAIFLDPVDNSKLINNKLFDFMNNDIYKLNYLKNVLILNAKKSYPQELDFSQFKLFDFSKMEDLSQTNKSKMIYEWSLFLENFKLPEFNMPFIPFFALDMKKLQKFNLNLNVKKIEAEDYGHSDILDTLWSDLMHATLSKGSDNREQENLDEYHHWLSQQIYDFLNEKENINLLPSSEE